MLKLINQFKWLPKENATQTVFSALQPAIRFTKDEYLDLPEMTYVKRQVELTPQQKKYYTLLKNRMIMQAAGEEITSVNAAVNMNKLLQISCGAVYSDTGEVVEFDIKNRYAVLKEVIEESNNKVLVFVPFKHAIDLIPAKLIEDGITAEVITSGLAPGKRAVTVMVGKSTLGRSLTGSVLNPSHPKNNIDTNNTLVATGRLMKMCDMFMASSPGRPAAGSMSPCPRDPSPIPRSGPCRPCPRHRSHRCCRRDQAPCRAETRTCRRRTT